MPNQVYITGPIYSKTFTLRDAEQGGQLKEGQAVGLVFLTAGDGSSPGIQLQLQVPDAPWLS